MTLRIKPTKIYVVKYNYIEPWEPTFEYPVAAYTTEEAAQNKCKKMNLQDHGLDDANNNVLYDYDEVILVC